MYKNNMQNLKDLLHKPILFNISVNKKVLPYVFTSLISILLVFSILGGLTFYYKSEIFSYFAKEYLKSQALATRNGGLDVDQDTQEMISLGTILGKAESPVLNQEGMVVDVVKKTNPAVVSIVITKEVPKYETYVDPNQQNNPFGDFFPGFNFSIPQYRQNGTEKKEIGGGGGGGADGPDTTNETIGAGGGAGGTSISFIDLTSTTSVQVVVGSGGVAGANTGTTGGTGGHSAFSTYASSTGGTGGVGSVANATGCLAQGGIGSGGVGGAGRSGDVNVTGGAGSPGSCAGESVVGGTGGEKL
jgi:hypothetical protein